MYIYKQLHEYLVLFLFDNNFWLLCYVIYFVLLIFRDILSGGEGRGGGNSRAAAQVAGCRRVSIQVVEGGEKYQEQDLMVAGSNIKPRIYLQ